MNEEVVSAIEMAIAEHIPLTVTYYGGSRPGSLRTISPTKMDGGKVWAFCEESGRNKSFTLGKIALPDSSTSNYDDYVDPLEGMDIPKLFDLFKNEWVSYGWHIEFGNNKIDLFRKFKNGNPLKWPHLSLYYDDNIGSRPTEDYEKHTRPWRAAGRDFKHFDHAVRHFIEASRIEPPVAGKRA